MQVAESEFTALPDAFTSFLLTISAQLFTVTQTAQKAQRRGEEILMNSADERWYQWCDSCLTI